MLYEIGEKPGTGMYQCARCCEWIVVIEDADNPLPPCDQCGSGADVRYQKIN